MKSRRPSMKPAYQRWTADHDRVLRELYGHAPLSQVAKRIGVSLNAVYRRCHYIGLSGGYATGRARPPAGGYFGPRVTVQVRGLPAGVVSVTRHRMIG